MEWVARPLCARTCQARVGGSASLRERAREARRVDRARALLAPTPFTVQSCGAGKAYATFHGVQAAERAYETLRGAGIFAGYSEPVPEPAPAASEEPGPHR